jgi:Undecaprenyl-phosphate glucose phosphotransferase
MSTENDSYRAEDFYAFRHLALSGKGTGLDTAQSKRVYEGARSGAAETLTSDKVGVLASSLRVGDALVFVCVGMWAGTADGRPLSMVLPVLVASLFAVKFTDLLDGYRIGALRNFWQQAGVVAVASLVWIATAWVASLTFFESDKALAIWLARADAIGFVLCLSTRAYATRRLAVWTRSGRLDRTVAIVGVNDVSRALIASLKKECFSTARIFGVYGLTKQSLPTTHAGNLVRGDLASVVEHVRDYDIDIVIIALPPEQQDHKRQAFDILSCCPCDLASFVEFEPFWSWHTQFVKLGKDAGLIVKPRPISGERGAYKSIFDRLAALALLIVLAPAFALVALAIRLESPGPVFFTQTRRGFKDRTFWIIKFRTMYRNLLDYEGRRQTTRDDDRVTRVGRVLRRTSIDEIPQLWNVLRGEMSLVGPRPHALGTRVGLHDLDDVASGYRLRHRVKPGITGLAQINGCRGPISTNDQLLRRLEYDISYIEHWTLLTDLKILALTITKGLLGPNAF